MLAFMSICIAFRSDIMDGVTRETIKVCICTCHLAVIDLFLLELIILCVHVSV